MLSNPYPLFIYCESPPVNYLFILLEIYYEQQVKREVKRIHISGYRCKERLKVKTDGSKCLVYTGLDHLIFVVGCVLSDGK